jgi:hypothetical protein
MQLDELGGDNAPVLGEVRASLRDVGALKSNWTCFEGLRLPQRRPEPPRPVWNLCRGHLGRVALLIRLAGGTASRGRPYLALLVVACATACVIVAEPEPGIEVPQHCSEEPSSGSVGLVSEEYSEELIGPLRGLFTEFGEGVGGTVFEAEDGAELSFQFFGTGSGPASAPDLREVGPVDVWWRTSADGTLDEHTTVVTSVASGEVVFQTGRNQTTLGTMAGWDVTPGLDDSPCPQVQVPDVDRYCWEWTQRRSVRFSRGSEVVNLWEGQETQAEQNRIVLSDATFFGGEFYGDICPFETTSYFITP